MSRCRGSFATKESSGIFLTISRNGYSESNCFKRAFLSRFRQDKCWANLCCCGVNGSSKFDDLSTCFLSQFCQAPVVGKEQNLSASCQLRDHLQPCRCPRIV